MRGDDALGDVCKVKEHASVAETALRWTVQQGIAVIPASTNPLHVRQNLLVGLEDDKFALSEDEMRVIDTKCERKKRRAPDLIGVWPETCSVFALLIGRLVAALVKAITFCIGPVDVLKLRRRWVMYKKKQRFPEISAKYMKMN